MWKVIIVSASLLGLFLFPLPLLAVLPPQAFLILNFLTLKTERATYNLLLFFIRGNLAKLHCVLFYLTAVLIFLFLWSIEAKHRIRQTNFLCRWYSKVSGDQASRETSPSMMSRWRKESVETHRPVSSTKFPPPPSPLVSLSSEPSLYLTGRG